MTLWHGAGFAFGVRNLPIQSLKKIPLNDHRSTPISEVESPPGPAVFQTLDRTARYPYAGSEYLRRVLWSVVQTTLFRLPLPRAYAWRRFWLNLFGARIEAPSAVAATTKI